MIKRGLMVLLFGVLGVIIIGCRGDIDLSTDHQALILTAGDTQQLSVRSSDKKGILYVSSDPSIITVSATGLVEAISEGEATITIKAQSDPDTSITIPVTVRKQIDLVLSETVLTLVVESDYSIQYTSNDGVSFTSSNPSVVTVNSEGTLVGVAPGEATVTVRSTYDNNTFELVTVHVFSKAEHVTITGERTANIGTPHLLNASVAPALAHDAVVWMSDDESIATINEEGVLTAISTGTVLVRALSAHDETIFDVITIEVIYQILVDITATTTEDVTYESMRYIKDVNLFDCLQEALLHAQTNAKVIVLEGTYDNNYVIDTPGVTLQGTSGAVIEGSIEVNASNTTITQLSFQGLAKVLVTGQVENLMFAHNTITNITYADGPFLQIEQIDTLVITQNTFEQLAHHAIVIHDVFGGTILIENNTIKHVQDAIVLDMGTQYASDTEVMIVRNTIEHMRNGLHITMQQDAVSHAILAYARFNSISQATGKLAIAELDSSFDFTLNHWGTTTPNETLFTNLTHHELRGHYTSKTSIPSESQYNPSLPAKILITNPIAEMMIGESYQLDYEILPIELDTDRIRWITSDPEVLGVNQEGILIPSRSGSATITVRSALNLTINSTLTVQVTTTPGIAFLPSRVDNGILVGDSFTLEAEAFPISYASELILFSSSNDSIATIDDYGVIETHAPGVVTFTAAYASDSTIVNTYTIEVFSSLNESSVLDVLTGAQMMYSTPREWTAYGVGFDYITKRYESVSRFYFDDVPVTEMLVPVFYAIRPGQPMNDHPEGITAFNPYNVYWVVIHDTANTNAGSGALAHANYLYNHSVMQTVLWTSWHYTIDDTYLYRHIPEIERAFHAGDGSSLPGQSTNYFGGGNRNGIGIEMAINQDGDMYRTWQRTAKLSADIMVRYNLPREHLTYHQDFSGKLCPRTLITAGMRPVFEEFVDIEYRIRSEFPQATIYMESHNPEYLDHSGRIIKMPQRAITVSYTVTVIVNGIGESRDFYTYLPGTDR